MKQIRDCPDYYITEGGEVISKRTKREKKLSLYVDTFGYYKVTMMTPEGKQRTERIHRLMMQTYGNPPPDDMKDPTVDHINGDKLDNRIDNLQWLSNINNAGKDKEKTYMIEDRNGNNFIVKNLTKWCKDNNLNRRNMASTYTKKCYCKGYRIIEKMQ